MPKPDPSRRRHSRFECDLPVEIYSARSQQKLADARLLDVSMGGGAVSCEVSLRRDHPYEFRFNWGKERLSVTGKVVWTGRPEKPEVPARFGVNFDLTEAQENLLTGLVEKLRRQQS